MKIRFIISVLLVFTFLVSCTVTDKKFNEKSSSRKVIVAVSIGNYDSDIKKTIIPDVPYDLNYTLYWKLSTESEYTNNQAIGTTGSGLVALLPGKYDFKMEGKRGETPVLTGEKMEVAVSGSMELKFTLNPQAAGDGSIDITLQWTVDYINNVSIYIDGEYFPDSDVTDKSVSLKIPKPMGSYLISFILRSDGGEYPSGTITEIVRVFPGVTTSKTITVNEKHLNSAPVISDFQAVYNTESNKIDFTWSGIFTNDTYLGITAEYYADDVWINESKLFSNVSGGSHSMTINDDGLSGRTYRFTISAYSNFGSVEVQSKELSIPEINQKSISGTVEGFTSSKTWGYFRYKVHILKEDTVIKPENIIFSPDASSDNENWSLTLPEGKIIDYYTEFRIHVEARNEILEKSEFFVSSSSYRWGVHNVNPFDLTSENMDKYYMVTLVTDTAHKSFIKAGSSYTPPSDGYQAVITGWYKDYDYNELYTDGSTIDDDLTLYAKMEPYPDPWTTGANSMPAYDSSLHDGKDFYYKFTSEQSTGTILGTYVYTSDSPLSKAVIHAGLAENEGDLVVKVRILPGLSTYIGSTANGVTSTAYHSYPSSYQIAAGNQDSVYPPYFNMLPGNKLEIKTSSEDASIKYNLSNISPTLEEGTDYYSPIEIKESTAVSVLVYKTDYSGVESTASIYIGKITFNSNGGVGTMGSQFVISGAKMTLIPNSFTRAGYAFKGWSLSSSGTVVYSDSGVFEMSNTDVTLYAVWK